MAWYPKQKFTKITIPNINIIAHLASSDIEEVHIIKITDTAWHTVENNDN